MPSQSKSARSSSNGCGASLSASQRMNRTASAISSLPFPSTSPAGGVIGSVVVVSVVVVSVADSSVNFNLFIWADAPKKSYVVSDVLKCVYETLNENNIQIPFPQRDIHIVKE